MAWEVGHPINKDGTNQTQRLPDALRPEQNPVDGRHLEDHLLLLSKLATQYHYYNEQNQTEGTWEEFFAALQATGDGQSSISIDSIKAYLTRAESRADNSVFMSLLLAFFQMYSHVQQDINALTQKHLDFYFKQALGFQTLPATPDKVHVLFELAPHAQQLFLPAGTALNAGKDAVGKALIYTSERDIVLNRAQLSAIKTTLLSPDGRVFAAAKANSSDGLGAALNPDLPQWPLFGDPEWMQAAEVGFALASPLFLLEEGKRTITIILDCVNRPDTEIPEQATWTHFKAFGTGTEAWIPLSTSVKFQDHDEDPTRFKVIWTIEQEPGDPPLVNYNGQVLEGDLQTHFPAIKFVVDGNLPVYSIFQNMSFNSVDVEVSVEAQAQVQGLQNLVLKNDYGALSNATAFYPFGPVPAKGSNFYIGSLEAFSKPLESLNILLHWADLPETSFTDHYENYPKLARRINFNVTLQRWENGAWKDISTATLFSYTDNNNKQLIDRHILSTQMDMIPLWIPGKEPYDEHYPKESLLRLVLQQDFGHVEAPSTFVKMTKDIRVNPPYTPKLQAISLGYQALSIHNKVENAGISQTLEFFHILPLGSEPISASKETGVLPILPLAALYLGFTGVELPQNLQILFQIAEGSGNSDTLIRPEDIEWSYLSSQGWRNQPLQPGEIIIDTTLGLQQSGIMAFQIGADAVKGKLQLEGGLYWLRASLSGKNSAGKSKDPSNAARAIAIHTQAISAVLQNPENAIEHLQAPLPAGSISALVERNSAIRKVLQPYPSFAGSPPEQGHSFYTRVSERLRHKQRAVTWWDMERIVLQKFSELFEVKAIPHTGFDEKGVYTEFLPGHTTLVLVPHLRNINAVNPFQPRTSVALRESVRVYLRPLCAAFALEADALHIVNPTYEPVLFSFSVGFHEGYDSGYYLKVLQDALRKRLSPWAYAVGEDIRFGNRIYKSQVLAFVEQLEYVDYVTDFKMLVENRGPGIGEMSVHVDLVVRKPTLLEDLDIAQASTATSILVSAQEHWIRVLQVDEYPCTTSDGFCDAGGIGCWYIDIDFAVSTT